MMMNDLRDGKIDCIIVKDLSRFGRDYLEVGAYLELILPLFGTRFISAMITLTVKILSVRQADWSLRCGI